MEFGSTYLNEAKGKIEKFGMNKWLKHLKELLEGKEENSWKRNEKKQQEKISKINQKNRQELIAHRMTHLWEWERWREVWKRKDFP